jgi:hypothetical protein
MLRFDRSITAVRINGCGEHRGTSGPRFVNIMAPVTTDSAQTSLVQLRNNKLMITSVCQMTEAYIFHHHLRNNESFFQRIAF